MTERRHLILIVAAAALLGYFAGTDITVELVASPLTEFVTLRCPRVALD